MQSEFPEIWFEGFGQNDDRDCVTIGRIDLTLYEAQMVLNTLVAQTIVPLCGSVAAEIQHGTWLSLCVLRAAPGERVDRGDLPRMQLDFPGSGGIGCMHHRMIHYAAAPW